MSRKPLQPDNAKHPDEDDVCSVASSTAASIRTLKIQTTVASAPTAPTFRCSECAEKRKEFYSKLEEKYQALEAKRNQCEARTKANGHRVMTISPRYDQYKDASDTSALVEIPVGTRTETVRFFHCYKRGVNRIFVDHPLFLAKIWGKTGGKIYGPMAGEDYEDNQLRFSLLFWGKMLSLLPMIGTLLWSLVPKKEVLDAKPL